MQDITKLGCQILKISLNILKFMELLIVLASVIFILIYLFRPTSKKEKDQFNDKDNWRGGF